MFNQNLDAMIRQHEAAAKEEWRAATLDILHKVKARAYPDIQAFKRDFEPYLSLLGERYGHLSECEPVRRAWTGALQLLTDGYWRKFRFRPDDLSSYR